MITSVATRFMRVLSPEHIPETLWVDDHLSLPPSLIEAYKCELEVRRLYDAALVHVSGSIHGGPTQSETDEHFARRFVNSASRALYAILSPCSTFEDVSNTFISILSYGTVAVLDVPCGTGAFSASVIALLIELRKHKVLPILPLTVFIFAGDYSGPSREVCGCMLDRLVAEANEVGISVRHEHMHWDATNHQDTAELIDRWFESTGNATDHLVMILNFSGEMHKAETFEKFSPSLNQILARLYNKKGAVLWLEPGTRNATVHLRERVVDLLGRVPYLKGLIDRYLPSATRHTDYRVRHPFQGTAFRCDVSELCFYPYLPRDVQCRQT